MNNTSEVNCEMERRDVPKVTLVSLVGILRKCLRLWCGLWRGCGVDGRDFQGL